MIQTMNSTTDTILQQINRENTFSTDTTQKKIIRRQPVSKSSSTTDKNSKQNYKIYDDFIKSHYRNSDSTEIATNTRIGGGKTNPEFKGGSFFVSDEEYPEFLKLYANSIIKDKKPEFLTEKQVETKCPILVDFDFRFSLNTESRIYTLGHIEDMIVVYQNQLKKIFQFDINSEFRVYIFEKPSINKVPEKDITKDGIHMIIGMQMSHEAQLLLRSMVIPELSETWSDLPLKNSWEEVLDEGISKGCTNWQLYGSRKPLHEAYELTHLYDLKYDATDCEFSMEKISLDTFNQIENIEKLSARYTKHPVFYYKNEFIDKLNQKSLGPVHTQRIQHYPMQMMDSMTYPNIKNKHDLDAAIQVFLDSIGTLEYELKEAYEYAMILPPSYYDKGSYTKWIRVGWALRNISNRLYVVWVAFSARAHNFDYAYVQDLYERWIKSDFNNPNGLTKYSLIHWAKIDGNHNEFLKIRNSTVDYYIEQTLNQKNDKKGAPEYDIATVLKQLFKEQYKCVDTKNNRWYEYRGHRWVEDKSGTSLRNKFSTTLREMYRLKGLEILKQADVAETKTDETNETDETDKTNETDETENKKFLEREKIKKIKNSKMEKVDNILRRLGTTCDKNNILTESKELFYDDDFYDKMDANPYLLCCNNGVIDFKEKVFRRGYPEDYLSKTTKIDYIPIDKVKHKPIIDKINDFMEKLFPIPELCNYMWQHLASTLIGTCGDQTFSMYIGDGRNGKSVLTVLM